MSAGNHQTSIINRRYVRISEKRSSCKICYAKRSEEHNRQYAMKYSKQVLYIYVQADQKNHISVLIASSICTKQAQSENLK